MSIHYRICLITGSYPPLRCGVGDYVSQLARTLAARGNEVHVITSKSAGNGGGGEIVHAVVSRWTPLAMYRLLRTIRALRPEVVHMQYPTNGYGYQIGPQALVMLCRLSGMKVITTSHEFIRARFLRKLSLIPLFLFSHALIFTSEEERVAISISMPWLRSKFSRSSTIIPVGTNIPVEAHHEKLPAGSRTVSFFGLFFPGRLIELVIDVFREISHRMPDVRFRFIGDVHPLHEDYFQTIRSYAERELPDGRFEWFTGRSPEEISHALSASAVCLLPYPDGATFRRTTLIAALALGIPVVTTRSDLTPKLLIEGQPVLFGNDRKHMAEQVIQVLSDHELAALISGKARKIAGMFSWDRIATDHLKAYERIVPDRSHRGKINEPGNDI
jgi:glycosyltransferase involved in cell wall biosynthesis